MTNSKLATFGLKNQVFFIFEKMHGASLSARLTGRWFEKNLNQHHFLCRGSSLFDMKSKSQNVKVAPAPLFHGLPLNTHTIVDVQVVMSLIF